MPIKPENRARYPKNWKQIRASILERAHDRCEFCGVENYSMRLNPKTGKTVKIILTIAHLDHTPENCDPNNLRALCQRCHNTYDAEHRKQTRQQNHQPEEEMNTIKEAMLRAWYEYRHGEIREGDDWENSPVKPSENFEEGFIAGIRYIMSLPLRDRLTHAEREKIKAAYQSDMEFAKLYQINANLCVNNACRIDYETSRDIVKSRAAMLVSIFGAAMFEEKENSSSN